LKRLRPATSKPINVSEKTTIVVETAGMTGVNASCRYTVVDMITIPFVTASLLPFRLGLIKSGPLTKPEIEKLDKKTR
jgi:hypothetical protein